MLSALRRRMPFVAALAAGGILWQPPSLTGQQTSAAAAEVFRKFSDRVVRVQVVETGSAAKSAVGSGFYVTQNGYVITNYHVISELIHSPERYRAEVSDVNGGPRHVTVLAIDVVNDLALLSVAYRPSRFFALEKTVPPQGTRLYSLGHPEDLGLSIVEGTYNGLLEHTLYPRLHFTGALNPGMSGGPTISEDGHVIGINVSTEGNELSFLVPVDRAQALLKSSESPNGYFSTPTLTQVGAQLRDYQAAYMKEMFIGPQKTVNLGPYKVVTQPAPFFRCWADAQRRPKMQYEQVDHRCSTDDYVFIAGDQSSGVITLKHQLITTDKMHTARFFSLYTDIFGQDETPWGQEEHVTAWRCSTRNVRNTDTRMRTALCLRRYKKIGELYDGVLKVAVLGKSTTGLVSTLSMSGVTFETVDQVSRRYLKQISWR
jgi:serine protease Do